MKWFEYAAPGSVAEAVELLAGHPGARALAGGTDLLVQMRSGQKESDLVVDLKRIEELNELSYEEGRGLRVGAAVPCCRIYEDGAVRRMYPALAEVAELIGGIQIQSRATIGGNLCNAAPSADSIPVLIVLGARCRIAGPGGRREVAAEEFCTGPGETVLAAGELLVSVEVPEPGARSGVRYVRFTPRNEMDIAVAGAAAAVELERGVFRRARVALAAVAPKPLLVREAGEWLEGKRADATSVQKAAEMAQEAAQPITDMRGTAEHRRRLCGVLTRKALEGAVERARRARR